MFLYHPHSTKIIKINNQKIAVNFQSEDMSQFNTYQTIDSLKTKACQDLFAKTYHNAEIGSFDSNAKVLDVAYIEKSQVRNSPYDRGGDEILKGMGEANCLAYNPSTGQAATLVNGELHVFDLAQVIEIEPAGQAESEL